MNFTSSLFKASKLFNKTAFLNNVKNLSTNKPIRCVSNYKCASTHNRSIPKTIFINHQKYVTICVKNFNNENTSNTPVDNNQQQSQEQKETPKKPSLFSRLTAKENVWKLSLGFMMTLIAGMGGYLIYIWGPPETDQLGNVINDEFSSMPAILQYPRRALHSAFINYQRFKDPTSEKLLPEPLQHPYYQPEYTLVIELIDVLVHPEWTYSTGWRYKKRPGLDYFLKQIEYPNFEVVFFTREPYTSLAPVVAALDPENHIQFKLFRESTKYTKGQYIKDLSCLNRDPKKIILIDSDEKAYQLQPRNALHRLKLWKGEEDDTDLVYMAKFLTVIRESSVEDVRDVLDYYNQEHDPLEAFKINQIKFMEAEEERQRHAEESKKKQATSPFSWTRKFY